MTAIAQTLDGKETFETREELFDYVLSELFEQEWFLVKKDENFFLKTAADTLSIKNVKIVGTIELNGIDITNSEMVKKLDFTKVIPKIIMDGTNGEINIFERNTFLYVSVYSGDNKPLGRGGREYMDLKIAPEYIKVLCEN